MGKGKKRQQHIVVFQDEEGQVLKTSFVPHGKKADPPSVPEKKGETAHHEICFLGWDKDITCVEDNLVVVARYGKVPKKYLVMYFDDGGKVLGTESVPYGSPAAMPYHPVREDTQEYLYEFAGWDKDLSSIRKDTMAKARFRKIRRRFRVRFLSDDGHVLKEEMVLYGKGTTAPEDPVKAEDPVCRYEFTGWDGTPDTITADMDIHACFRGIKRWYHVSFYKEQELLSVMNCHYGTPLEYPDIGKKGYALTWEPMPDRVNGDLIIRASYDFVNKKGTEHFDQGNRYQIVNPSVSRGTVRLLSYKKEGRRVTVPSRVLLGDFYYTVEEIGPRAFEYCQKMETLILPDSLRVVGDEAVSGCHSLKEIVLGKGVRRIGRHAFSENTHLRKIRCFSDTLHSIHREAFDRMDSPVVFSMKKTVYDRRFSLCERAMGAGMIIPERLS